MNVTIKSSVEDKCRVSIKTPHTNAYQFLDRMPYYSYEQLALTRIDNFKSTDSPKVSIKALSTKLVLILEEHSKISALSLYDGETLISSIANTEKLTYVRLPDASKGKTYFIQAHREVNNGGEDSHASISVLHF